MADEYCPIGNFGTCLPPPTASISMQLQSQAVSMTVPKPGNGSAAVQLVVQAVGESRMAAAYSASMARRSGAADDAVLPNSNRTWNRLDEAGLSFDGHHILWSMAPPAHNSNFELDGKKNRFTVIKEYSFQLGVDCHGAAACVADGDIIDTVIEVSSESGSLQSAVRITTHVESLISCEHSRAWIEGGLESVPTSTAMRVYLHAYDVDMLPVSFNRAPVEFRFGSKLLPQKWNRGSNEYVAELSADVTENAGQYELVVEALKGSNNRGQSMGRCILLRRSIEVFPEKTQSILAGSLAGVMVLTLGMLGYLLYRNKESWKRALFSFLSFEGLLVLEMCMEIWVGLEAASCAPSS
jgi:hypothetical protein